jgi:hypothetical protein
MLRLATARSWRTSRASQPVFLLLWPKDGYLRIDRACMGDRRMPEEFPSVERLRRWRPEEIHSASGRDERLATE